MMRRNIFLILVLSVMILFASCSSDSGARRSGYEIESFNGGSSALFFEFLENAPPSVVRDQELQPFQVIIRLKNQGEFDIGENEAYAVLAGFKPEDLGLTDEGMSKAIPPMNGFKKQGSNVIEGRTQQVTFSNLKYTESVISGAVSRTIFANVCYPYETRAFTLLCINGDTTTNLDKSAEICELSSERAFANSGAPVHIENVKQSPYGASSIFVQFDIVHTPTSANAGLYERGSIDSNCNIDGNSPTGVESLGKKDRVSYSFNSGLDGVDCDGTGSGNNTVILTDNRYTVTCVQDTTGEREYEKPATITLQYDYWDRIETSITIEHVNR